MSEFIAWSCGIVIGFLWGAYMMFTHMNDKTTIHKIVKMTEEEAREIVDNFEAIEKLKEAIEKLKKELNKL